MTDREDWGYESPAEAEERETLPRVSPARDLARWAAAQAREAALAAQETREALDATYDLVTYHQTGRTVLWRDTPTGREGFAGRHGTRAEALAEYTKRTGRAAC